MDIYWLHSILVNVPPWDYFAVQIYQGLKADIKSQRRNGPPQPDLRVLHETGACAFSRFLFTRIQQNLDHGHLHSDEPLGLTYYAALCDSSRPPLDIIYEHADRYMELFEYEQAWRLHIGKARVEDGFTVAQEDGMIASQPLNLPPIGLTNARVLYHRDLFPFHGWCHPLVRDCGCPSFDRTGGWLLADDAFVTGPLSFVPFWVNRLISRKKACCHQQSHLYWN